MIRYIYFVSLLFPILFWGCATTNKMSDKNLGSIKESREITNMYGTYTIEPDLNYFYYGRELQPDAIMGIRKNYTIQSKFWHAVALTEDQLKNWVVWGNRGTGERCASSRYNGRYQGADILDPDGNVIGNWYSKRDWGIFEFPGNNVVIPHPPRNQEGWSYRTCT